MGAIPAAVLARPGRTRGDHPLGSFAAVGALAHELTAPQRGLDVFAPLRALAERGGLVILIGVGLERMTLLHAAEQAAGRTMFRRWASDGASVCEVESGGCSDGFGRLEPVLEPLARRVRVGKSGWAGYPVAAALELAARAIRADPAITRCARPECARCQDAVAGGPLVGQFSS